LVKQGLQALLHSSEPHKDIPISPAQTLEGDGRRTKIGMFYGNRHKRRLLSSLGTFQGPPSVVLWMCLGPQRASHFLGRQQVLLPLPGSSCLGRGTGRDVGVGESG